MQLKDEIALSDMPRVKVHSMIPFIAFFVSKYEA